MLLLKEAFKLTQDALVFVLKRSGLFFFFGSCWCFPSIIRLIASVFNCQVAHVSGSLVIYIKVIKNGTRLEIAGSRGIPKWH